MKFKTREIPLRTLFKAVGLALLLSVFGGFFESSVGAAKTCPELFNEHRARVSKPSPEIRSKLPERGSAEYLKIVNSVREQLEKKSYAVINLEHVFTESFGQAWFQSMPNKVSSQLYADEFLHESPTGQVRVPISKNHKESVAQFQEWFSNVIQDASGYQIESGYTGVRLSTEIERGTNFDRWHLDGQAWTVSMAAVGIGTEGLGPIPEGFSMARAPTIVGGDIDWAKVCTGCRPFTVPRGHALIISGQNNREAESKFPPLIHRSPLEFGERLLFISRYQ